MTFPAPKTYRSDLEDALRAAERQGIHIGVVPAMLRPKEATFALLRDLGECQQQFCKQCQEKGIVCRPTNLS